MDAIDTTPPLTTRNNSKRISYKVHLPSISRAACLLGILLCIPYIPHASVDTLSASQLHLRDSLLNSYTINYCCGSTLQKCLEKKKHCFIAGRLETFLTWLVGTVPDPDPVKVREQLDQRYTGFTTEKKVRFDTTHLQMCGRRDAPVIITVYVSAYCPTCKKRVKELHDTIMNNKRLKNTVALFAKPVGRGIANMALLAAAEDGKFWDLFTAFRRVYSVVKDRSDIIPIAKKAGVLSDHFLELLADTTLQQRLQANTEESRRNDVKHFPAWFINYHPYTSYGETRWILDAIEFERLKLRNK